MTGRAGRQGRRRHYEPGRHRHSGTGWPHRWVAPPPRRSAQLVPQSTPVVEAFNKTFAPTLLGGDVDGQQLDVLIAADDDDAKQKVSQLVADGGLRSIDVGPLGGAQQLRQLGFLHISIQQLLGLGFGSTIKLHPLEPSRSGARGAMNAEQTAPRFERDIHPLFRQEDVSAMSFAFDLASYQDVRTHAEAIYQRLADGSMPCDSRWPPEQVERFRAWIDTGSPPRPRR